MDQRKRKEAQKEIEVFKKLLKSLFKAGTAPSKEPGRMDQVLYPDKDARVHDKQRQMELEEYCAKYRENERRGNG